MNHTFKSDIYLLSGIMDLTTLHSKGFKNSGLTRVIYSDYGSSEATEFICIEYQNEDDPLSLNSKIVRRISTYRGNGQADFILGNFISYKYDLFCDVSFFTVNEDNKYNLSDVINVGDSVRSKYFPNGIYCKHNPEDFIDGVYNIRAFGKRTGDNQYDIVYANFFLEVKDEELHLYEDLY